jgi:hypothetical protein
MTMNILSGLPQFLSDVGIAPEENGNQLPQFSLEADTTPDVSTEGTLVAQVDAGRVQKCATDLAQAKKLINEVLDEVFIRELNHGRLSDMDPETARKLEKTIEKALIHISEALKSCKGVISEKEINDLKNAQKELTGIRERLQESGGAAIDLKGLSDALGFVGNVLGGALMLLLQFFGVGPDQQRI